MTRWAEYGILSCLYLAGKFGQGPVGAVELAEANSIPVKYAQQILHRLRKGGVILSVRGPHGGFVLAKEPATLNLQEVVQAAQGCTLQLSCDGVPGRKPACTRKETCPVSPVWGVLKDEVDRVLSSRTIADLLVSQRQKIAQASGA